MDRTLTRSDTVTRTVSPPQSVAAHSTNTTTQHTAHTAATHNRVPARTHTTTQSDEAATRTRHPADERSAPRRATASSTVRRHPSSIAPRQPCRLQRTWSLPVSCAQSRFAASSYQQHRTHGYHSLCSGRCAPNTSLAIAGGLVLLRRRGRLAGCRARVGSRSGKHQGDTCHIDR